MKADEKKSPSLRRAQASKLAYLRRRVASAPHGQKRQREEELSAWMHAQLRSLVAARAAEARAMP